VTLTIDTASAVPPFEQLRQQIVAQVRRGELPSGTQLPTVRRLAADLGLAPNTVARTYKELETAGVVQTAGRRGTVVAPRTGGAPEPMRSVGEFVARMRSIGVPVGEAVRLVRLVYDLD
jgi:GntR family transcriptional regulator